MHIFRRVPRSAALAALTTGLLVTANLLAPVALRGRSRGHAAASATVVIHMTGLLLIAPARPQSPETVVLLPPAAGHVALLGFGRTASSDRVTNLCLQGEYSRAYDAGICYVDLDSWVLLPFGDGGEPPSAGLSVPAGLMDVSDASGGRYRVPVNANDPGTLVFKTGWFGPTTCSLANWTYTPVDEFGVKRRARTQPLYNLVDWEITFSVPPQLRFVSSSGDTVVVDLPAPDGENRIEILLAHVPYGDRVQLPPAGRTTVAGAVDSAAHFHAYYDVLRQPNDLQTKPNRFHRPVPRNGQPTTVLGCHVRITTPIAFRGGEPPDSRAIGTYACMPATGIK